jgi:hypothetical protein
MRKWTALWLIGLLLIVVAPALAQDATAEAVTPWTSFIDYILHPQVGAYISNYVVDGTPNQVALDLGLILEEYRNNPAIYPSEEVRARLFQIESLPDAETFYNNAWDEIKIALGQ